MRERGIRLSFAELVMREGEPMPGKPNRWLFTQKLAQSLVVEGALSRDEYKRLEHSLPLICVIIDGKLITTYRAPKNSRCRQTSELRPLTWNLTMDLEDLEEMK
jgi:hypothetical protein